MIHLIIKIFIYRNFNYFHLIAEKYELAELDRKKPKVARKGLGGSYIRYHSTAMPLIEEIPDTNKNDDLDLNKQDDILDNIKLDIPTDLKPPVNKDAKLSILEEAIKV